MTKGWVDLDGTIVPAHEARVSVFDRGLTRGDSIFETARVYGGVAFMLEAHLQRLGHSAFYVGFPVTTELNLEERAQRLLAAGRDDGLMNAVLRIQVTSGDAMELAPITQEIHPTSILTLTPLPALPDFSERGASAMISSVRRNHRLALDPLAKTGSYLNNVLAGREARRLGFDEAILLNLEGHVAEGATANLFAWIEDCWYTPSTESGILDGITRRVLLELCAENELPAVEHRVSVDDLELADELFVCSSIREIMPVTTLNGEPVGTGRIGEETARLYSVFSERVKAEVEAKNVL